MKASGLLCCQLVGAFTLFSQTTQIAKDDTGKEDPDDVYQKLSARLREGDLSIDFRALRFACSASRNCEVRANLTDHSAESAAQLRGDLDTARQLAEKILTRGYADVETHASLVGIYAKLGDQKRSNFHLAVVLGFLRSIRASAGENQQAALEVISNREISSTMASMGLPYMGSGVTSQQFKSNGHQYTVMKALDPKTKQLKRVYFNLDHVNAAKDVTNRP